MKKAAIFDLDGTLSDSIMSMKYSGDKTMAEFGYGPFSVCLLYTSDAADEL